MAIFNSYVSLPEGKFSWKDMIGHMLRYGAMLELINLPQVDTSLLHLLRTSLVWNPATWEVGQRKHVICRDGPPSLSVPRCTHDKYHMISYLCLSVYYIYNPFPLLLNPPQIIKTRVHLQFWKIWGWPFWLLIDPLSKTIKKQSYYLWGSPPHNKN